jgi:hypothetical protein
VSSHHERIDTAEVTQLLIAATWQTRSASGHLIEMIQTAIPGTFRVKPLSDVDERHVGAASGMLTMMQRGGNAIGVAILGVPFFTVLRHAMAEGAGHSAAYVRAFACGVCWIIALLLVVVVLLMLEPPSHYDRATCNQASRRR